jgi:hypothetical protein
VRLRKKGVYASTSATSPGALDAFMVYDRPAPCEADRPCALLLFTLRQEEERWNLVALSSEEYYPPTSFIIQLEERWVFDRARDIIDARMRREGSWYGLVWPATLLPGNYLAFRSVARQYPADPEYEGYFFAVPRESPPEEDQER